MLTSSGLSWKRGSSLLLNLTRTTQGLNPVHPPNLPADGFVTLKVYNMLGQEVVTLVSDNVSADRYEVEWNATGIASGVYLYRMQAGDFVETKKLLLLQIVSPISGGLILLK